MKAFELVDRYLPREVLAPIALAFAFENVLSYLFGAVVPPVYAAVAWLVVFIVALTLVVVWQDVDESDNFE